MKTTLILILLLSAFKVSVAQDAAKPSIEPLQLKEKSFDFGKIVQGRPVTHAFEITNTGSEPLKIENVQTSCGCTTPEWSRDPIAPGQSSTITVGYNAAADGPFTKTVSILYNNNKQAGIVISGNVYKAPATPAPVNPSIALLKQINQ